MHETNATYVPAARRRAEITRHAAKRAQQRGLGADRALIIEAFGEPTHDGIGGIRYLMTDKAMSRLTRALGRNQCIDGLAGTYIVVSAADGQVITMGHRYS